MGSLRIEGLDEFRAALRKFPQAAQKGAKRGMTRGVLRVQRSARENAPVDTGRLRASIAYRVESLAAGVRGIIGSAVHYAPYQEWGTKHFAGRHYMSRAIDANMNDVVADLVREINAEIAKLAG